MSDDETRVISPYDPNSIIKLQDPTVIEQLLENPPAILAEILAGWFSVGNGFLAAAGCRVAQAAFKGRVFQQFAKEFHDLRQKGQISDDFAEKKYGSKSWVELLTILDDEVPDEDRAEALKAMFYEVNKINSTDAQRVISYQLFQIAKAMTSGELLLLKAVYEASQNSAFSATSGNVTLERWAQTIAGRLGHGLYTLVIRDSIALEQQGLINARVQMGATPQQLGENIVNPANARITALGIRFCENIKEYRAAFDIA